MVNPFFKSRSVILFYISIWILITALHISVLVSVLEKEIAYSIADSLVFNSLFAFVGLGLWYPVRYISLENYSLFKILANHFIGAALSSGVWIYSCYIIMGAIFPEERLFLEDTLFWRFLLGALYYNIIVGAYYSIKYYYSFQETSIKETRLASLIKEAELKSLRYQINPHFLFNSLNSISSLTIYDPDKAREMTIKLSDFLRSTLSKNIKQKHTLAEELKNLRLYTDIEKVRFEDKFEFIEQVDENCLNAQIPNMILQPLLENAIKYGVYESAEKVYVKLACKAGKDYLILKVENNFDPEAVFSKGEGIGLANIRNRLQLIYRQENLITTRKMDDFFIVNIFIPLEDMPENRNEQKITNDNNRR